MKRSLHYSLVNLLLVATIVAFAIALYVARSQLREAQAELDRVKILCGELSIGNGSEVHAISVPTADAMDWRWRIYLPGGHDFGLYAYRGELDASGLPLSAPISLASRIGGPTSPHEPREILIDIALGTTPNGESCLWISENGIGKAPIVFGTSPPTWTGSMVMFSERVAGKRGTVSGDATAPLGLISLDGIDSAGNHCEDAILVWIGPYEQAPMGALRERGILEWR